MSPRQRHSLWAVAWLVSLVFMPSALAETNPLELGDETIWLGDVEESTATPKAEPTATHEADSSPAAESVTTTETQAVTPAEPDTTPLLRTSAVEEKSEVSKAASERSTSSWWRTLVSLGAVVGLIALLAWGYKLTGGFNGGAAFFAGQRRTQLLEVIGRTSLSPRHSVCLVRAGGRVVMVGLSGDRMSPLDVVTEGEAAKLLGLAAQERSDSAKTLFEQTLVEESAQYDSAASEMPLDDEPPQRDKARDTIASTLARLRTRVGRGIGQKVG